MHVVMDIDTLMLRPFYFVKERFSGILRYTYLKHT